MVTMASMDHDGFDGPPTWGFIEGDRCPWWAIVYFGSMVVISKQETAERRLAP